MLYSSDGTNTGISFVLLIVNLCCHLTFIEQELYNVSYGKIHVNLFYQAKNNEKILMLLNITTSSTFAGSIIAKLLKFPYH